MVLLLVDDRIVVDACDPGDLPSPDRREHLVRFVVDNPKQRRAPVFHDDVNGVRPKGTYPVSFVYPHSATPFARKGEMEMTLPAMDIPISILDWEVFVPSDYSVRAIDGNVITRRVVVLAVKTERKGLESAIAGGDSRWSCGDRNRD